MLNDGGLEKIEARPQELSRNERNGGETCLEMFGKEEVTVKGRSLLLVGCLCCQHTNFGDEALFARFPRRTGAIGGGKPRMETGRAAGRRFWMRTKSQNNYYLKRVGVASCLRMKDDEK